MKIEPIIIPIKKKKIIKEEKKAKPTKKKPVKKKTPKKTVKKKPKKKVKPALSRAKKAKPAKKKIIRRTLIKKTPEAPLGFGGTVILELEGDKPKRKVKRKVKRKPVKRKKRLVRRKTKKKKRKPVKKKAITRFDDLPEEIEFIGPKKEEIKKEEFVTIERKKVPIKEEFIELKETEQSKQIKKQEEEWKKGPEPSQKRPPTPQYAFEPTNEELQAMKNIKTGEREEGILKPTQEEEKVMESIREPDMATEFKPTKEETSFMKGEGTITKEKMIEKKEIINNRTKTGIDGIDEILGGGLPRKKAVAVVGGPGTGKSILLMQFLVNGAIKYGEPGIYVTFEEEINELKENYKKFNFDIDKLEKKGLLKIVHYNPMRVKRFVRNMDVTLRDLIKSMKAKRIVIDSLSAFTLLYGNEGQQREGLFSLFQTLKKLGVTTLLSTESWREPSITKSGVIEFISDGVIMLYNLKIGDTRVRAVEVLKMRGIKHEARIVPFKILEEGIKVFTEEEVFGGQKKELDQF